MSNAAENGHLDVVKYLAGECQANVNMKDNVSDMLLVMKGVSTDITLTVNMTILYHSPMLEWTYSIV